MLSVASSSSAAPVPMGDYQFCKVIPLAASLNGHVRLKSPYNLTPREEELSDLIEEGCGNKDIARRLNISEETVKRHISNIFDKSGMSTRLEYALHRTKLRSDAQVYIDFDHNHFIRFFRGVTLNFTPAQIWAKCQQYGSQLQLPAAAGIDGARLMFAISGAESSFGKNCNPRHEPAYDLGGYYERHSAEDQQLIREYGHAGACSYGPWQVLLASVPKFTPTDLLGDLDKNAQAFVDHVNGFVLGFRRAKTIQQIAETYNSGDFSSNPAPGVLKYAQQVSEYYASAHLPT